MVAAVANSGGPRHQQLAPTTVGPGLDGEALEYWAACDWVRANAATDLHHDRLLVTESDQVLASGGRRSHVGSPGPEG